MAANGTSSSGYGHSHAHGHSGPGSSGLRDLVWSDAVDENEMDEECLKSSNEQYALWTTDVLLHSSSTGTYYALEGAMLYCTVPYSTVL